MSDHRSIYKVPYARSEGYREVSEAEAKRLCHARIICLEGVDGDEDANTVTYWYTREVPSI